MGRDDNKQMEREMEIRVYFKDEVNSCSMYRTFATITSAEHAITMWHARNTPGQYRYYTAGVINT